MRHSLSIALLLVSAAAQADVTLPYAGRIVSADGQPASGATTFVVRFFRAADGGAPLTFRYRSGGVREAGEVRVRDEVAELLAALEGILGDEGLEVALSERILDLPGLGLCVPDLVLRKRKGTGKKAKVDEVYVELLGFWSRESVWKRVELVERGLGERIVFAVSSRLRVSEEVLDGSESASLYVYKGRINPRALLRSVLGVLGSKR